MKQQGISISLAIILAGFGATGAAFGQAQPTQGDGSGQDGTKQPPPAQNDPFFRYTPPKPKKVLEPEKPVPIPFPTLEQRQQDFKQEKVKARNNRMPDPNPVGQFLVSELTVTGVFETDTGLGAFVQAPDKTMYFINAGTKVFNGELVEIKAADDPPRVVFRERVDYSYKKQVKTEIRPVEKQVTKAG
jgi:hypothetical protein